MLSTFVTNLLYSVFFATQFFTTISNLSTSVFKLAKFDFSAKLLTPTCDTFFKSVFVA